ncbi:MAG: serine hydrolase [Candidatus Marinimicrobia bacterium]|nr:serine hydrolase [Candidatus Neomarinimicrobiota bacterium]MBL7022615.1 serine hydrolase [Candidatus Neomarinimicrobiota bacterium]MBL7109642.1 serine hydrolase [Candidatus Neomarinimicrobiota bacterium]
MKTKFIFLLILFLGCSQLPTPTPQQNNISDWHTLSLKQKIAQMVMVRVRGDFYNNENWYRKKLQQWIEKDGIGGIITFGGSIQGTYSNIQRFQSWADIPLLVSADYERGTGQWLDGGTLFPSNMAVTATDSSHLAYLQGKITAKEASSLGVHISFAPVMDVNNNPDNPIINFRAYSDSPEIVAKFGVEFIKGLQDGGVYACAKHFPGHGNTATDSHTSLPIIHSSLDELYETELHPFQLAIESGVKTIMVGHISLPELDESGKPASHSFKILTEILRNEFNFSGLIITDGMEMGGLTNSAWAGESAIRAVEAGADILLLPMNVEHTINAIEQAVKSGRITEERINESVNRIFRAKEEFGLFSSEINSNWENVEENVGISSHKKIAKEIAKKSITLIKNDANLIPLKPENIEDFSHIILSTDDGVKDVLSSYAWDIRNTHGNVQEIWVTEPLGQNRTAEILQSVKNSDMVLVTLLVRIRMDKGESTIDASHSDFMKLLEQNNIPFVVAGFGSPYLPNYDIISTYLCAYGYGSISQYAMANALLGRTEISGKLSVKLSDDYPRGSGIVSEKRNIGFDGNMDINLTESLVVLENAIEDKIFPGAQVFIAKNGKVIANQGFGNQTYDDTSKVVNSKTIYDIASLTKVLVTTPVMMKLISQKKLSLDHEVSQFYPEFVGGGKEKVTIHHLLTHSSGIEPYIMYFMEEIFKNKEDILNDILQRDLIYEPGTEIQYSDLGIILLTSIIEKIEQKPIDELAQKWVFNPIDMQRTFFKPNSAYLPEIAPTEFDSIYRNIMIHGIVHDENTYLMGGVSGHAGVFSTAEDIGKYAQIMLNKGTWLSSRLFKKSLIHEFTSRQNLPFGSDRAIGWDTPSRNGKSSAGDYFSDLSFGHLGFTGTSLWIDPEQEIIVVLLTNRVHPSRENNRMYKVRRDFHNAVMKKLEK